MTKGTRVIVTTPNGDELGVIVEMFAADRNFGATVYVEFADRTVCRFPMSSIRKETHS